MDLVGNREGFFKEHLVELLKGGFAPVVILLKEFHYEKTGTMLDGLPFSTLGLLEHMRHRQKVLLNFIKDPDGNQNVWPGAYWPEQMVPDNEEAWKEAINRFEEELEEMIHLVENTGGDKLLEVQANGKTIAWAAMTAFHHNAYHIGQIKAIGRQLGVW